MNYKYPKRFYEPIRIQIAADQMRHDFRKLFPTINYKEWREIDAKIEEWFWGEKFELEAAHDFWNFFGGFARDLKGKSLLSWLTAENVVWTKEEILTKEIILTWDFPGFEFMGKSPYRADSVLKRINQPGMELVLDNLTKDSDFHSNKFAPRDHFPIVVFDDIKGGVLDRFKGPHILEGNRRTVRAIVKDEEKISAYVARFTSDDDVWPTNYWISAGELRDLIFLSVFYEKIGDKIAFRTIRDIYQLLMRDFEIVRFMTFDKSFKNFETSEHLLRDIFMEDLK